jgi:hypothetical protein
MTKRARVPGLYLEVLLRVHQYNILTDKQHGFRRKRSCETQLVTTIQKIAQNFRASDEVVTSGRSLINDKKSKGPRPVP